tara:strand:- start:830 stop:1039 length:210 start_codon:yes stop_codon:yes gene_type:complete
MSRKAEKVGELKDDIIDIDTKDQIKSSRLDVNTLLKRLKEKEIKDKKITVILVVSVLIIAVIAGVNLVL